MGQRGRPRKNPIIATDEVNVPRGTNDVPTPETPVSLQNDTPKPIKKHQATTPWKPASLLDIPERLKDPHFTYRFCDKGRVGNIQKKQAEGWEVDTELSKKINRMGNIQDGSSIDTTLHMRELIIMRMPKEMAKSRAEYYAKLSGAAQKDAQDKFKTDTKKATEGYDNNPFYGSVDIQQGR